jgi:hypothetical protein
MQNELNGMNLAREVQILGVNEEGFEAGNASISSGRDVPWLQDESPWNVWDVWAPGYRDVIVLDEDNVEITAFNLTSLSLAVPANYDALLDIFVDAANAP